MKIFSGLLASIFALTVPLLGQASGIDFSRFVAVGDSLTAGFQNFSLEETQQPNGYASLLAKQANTTLTLPLIGPPGAPPKLILFNGTIVPSGNAPGVRINPLAQATNLAVPGQTLNQVMTLRPDCNPATQDPIVGLTNAVLGLPGCLADIKLSQLEWVEAFAANPATRPTTIAAWAGNNDVLFSVLIGNEQLVTPPVVFGLQYGQWLSRLKNTNAKLVIANIPDVTAIPYLTSVEALAAQLQRPAGQVAAALGVKKADYLLAGAVLWIQANGVRTLPATCPAPLVGLPNQNPPCVLRAAQVESIQRTVDTYNVIIAGLGAANRIPVVNINRLFKNIVQNGVVVNGQVFTTAPFGGIFSLDMVHPTNLGYAVVANEFIKTLNQSYGAGLPSIDLATISNN